MYGATAAVSEAKPRRLQGRALAAVALVSAALGVAASVAFRRGGAIQMMCSAKETVCRSADSRTHDNCVTGIYVICGDACAYKGHAKHSTDAGTRREPDLGAIGLVASAIGATILF